MRNLATAGQECQQWLGSGGVGRSNNPFDLRTQEINSLETPTVALLGRKKEIYFCIALKYARQSTKVSDD